MAGGPTAWRSCEVVRQLDVCRHPIPARRHIIPYLVVLQYDSVLERDGLVLAPLVTPDRALNSRLYPTFVVQGASLMLLTPAIGTIAKRLLRRPVMNLEENRYRITSALDMLFAGS